MISRTACRIFHAACSRTICMTPQVSRFLPYIQLSSKLVSTDGLLREQTPEKAKKAFDEQEHEQSQAHCYGTINIDVQGYDMVVVEKFAKNIHKFVQEQKITVKEVYALPPEFTKVKYIGGAFTSKASEMITEAELTTYTRIIQISNLKSTFAPILVKSLMREVPPGVKLSITKYTEEDFLKRYKENKELLTAKDELARLRAMR